MKYWILALVLTAGGGSKKPEAPAVAEKKEVPVFHPDPATAGKIEIVTSFRGNKPPAKKMMMEADADCQKLSPKGVAENVVVTDSQGHLANVMVYIKTGLAGKRFAPPKEVVMLEQKGCMYVPRVMGVQAGQPISVKNGDPL